MTRNTSSSSVPTTTSGQAGQRVTGPSSGAICENCHDRVATEIWIGEDGYLALTRSYMQSWWCHRCVVQAQLDYAYRIAGQIAGLERELQKLNDAEP